MTDLVKGDRVYLKTPRYKYDRVGQMGRVVDKSGNVVGIKWDNKGSWNYLASEIGKIPIEQMKTEV